MDVNLSHYGVLGQKCCIAFCEQQANIAICSNMIVDDTVQVNATGICSYCLERYRNEPEAPEIMVFGYLIGRENYLAIPYFRN